MIRPLQLTVALLAVTITAGVWFARPVQAAGASALLESTSRPGATDCPDAGALAAMVNDGLGRSVLVTAASTAADGPRVRVVVSFARAGKSYAATVNVGDGRGGTRTLADRGPGCGALANAVAVLLVVLLDSGPESLGSVAGSSSPSSPSSQLAPEDAASSPAALERRTVADVGVGGGIAQGLVGGWSPAVGLGGTLAYRHWAARVGGVWFPPQANDYGPGRVEVGLAVVRVALCASTRAGLTRVTLALCAQQQVGWMRGRGMDYEQGNRAADHLWLAAGAAAVARGPLGRAVGWEVEVGAVRPLRQQRFVVDNLGTAFQSDPLAVMTTLSLTTRVW
jgi:hypothetical protein